MSYSGDVWLTPIVITTANQHFCFTHDTDPGPGIAYRVALTPKTYWPHNDSDFAIRASYPAFYRDLTEAMNTAASASYSTNVVTPTLSTGVTNGGLRIRLPGVTEFSVDFSGNGAGTFTMDQRWFGFRQNASSTKALQIGGNYDLISPYTVRQRWYSWSLADGIAVDKASRPYRLIRYSSPRPSDAVSVEWDAGRWRKIRYEHVYGAHVLEKLALLAAFTDVSITGLAQLDTHNAWETVWQSLGSGEKVLIVHNNQAQLDLTSNYDAVKSMSEEQGQELEGDSARLMRTNGMFFDVGADVYLVDQQYDH